MTTNINPDTGIPFGYIRADAIHPELWDQLCYSHGTDVNYEAGLAAHLAEKKQEHEELAGEDDLDFDEMFETQEFNDSYQCDEPIYEGEHEGVTYRTSWLGGAPHLWVFKSPVLTKCNPCSICVPNAGNLDQVGDYLAYGVPSSWLDTSFMRDLCIDEDFEFAGTAPDFFWREVDNDSKNGGPFKTMDECAEDCYSKNFQHKVGLTLDEIKAAVDAGQTVHWCNTGYKVIKDQIGQYLIVYYDTNAIGLTHQDGVTLNGKPDQFFIG